MSGISANFSILSEYTISAIDTVYKYGLSTKKVTEEFIDILIELVYYSIDPQNQIDMLR